MHILLIGSGGREHALAWKIKQSPLCEQLTIMPGNGGTASLGENIPISATDIPAIVDWSKQNKPDLVVIGPDDPIALGLADELQQERIKTFGPNRSAARMESSKAFAKSLMLKYNIPTGSATTFTSYEEAQAYLKQHGAPIVVKASGLAAGKGVVVCKTTEQAEGALTEIMLDRIFGEAGSEVVLEEYLEGPEVSYLCFVDGKTIVPMSPVCDYKRAFDNDEGLNTGGMGVYSPPGFFSSQDSAWVQQNIAEKTLQALQSEGIEYKGVLYIGLMMTKNGPKVIEYNARFGDPETQVLMPVLETDLVEIMLACIDGTLEKLPIIWSQDPILGVILASGGYPGSYQKGYPIHGLDKLPDTVQVFHAGTKLENGLLVTAGGRVLCIVAKGQDMKECREKAYQGVHAISFERMQFRTDIGLRECITPCTPFEKGDC